MSLLSADRDWTLSSAALEPGREGAQDTLGQREPTGLADRLCSGMKHEETVPDLFQKFFSSTQGWGGAPPSLTLSLILGWFLPTTHHVTLSLSPLR